MQKETQKIIKLSAYFARPIFPISCGLSYLVYVKKF